MGVSEMMELPSHTKQSCVLIIPFPFRLLIRGRTPSRPHAVAHFGVQAPKADEADSRIELLCRTEVDAVMKGKQERRSRLKWHV